MKLYCKDNSHEYGAIGVKTPLVDKNAHQLCVGDVVVLRNKTCQWSKLRFAAYDYRTKSYYIMGNYQGAASNANSPFAMKRYPKVLELATSVTRKGENMNKAILVIDMPSCCDECFALDDNGDYPFCLITQEQRGYTFRPREKRMDKCPFKSTPSSCAYSGHLFDQYGDGFADGYNTCLEEILGQ